MILIGILVTIAAAFLILRHGAPTWTAVTDGNSYGAKVEADGSFDFPQSPNSIHYVTKPCDGLMGTQIRLKYKIEGGPFFPASDPQAPSRGPTLYFERKGDDWQTDGYRWYATFCSPSPIIPGEFEIVAAFNEKWTSVETYNSVDQHTAFVEALNNASRVGFVFGGGTGYGHGVYGQGRFTLLEFSV